MHNHQRLAVWHRANALSAAIHIVARAARWRDAPGLRAQLLRAVASISANIAEGAGHASDLQFAHFLTIAIGSANEAESHLILAKALGVFDTVAVDPLLSELDQIRRMLFALRKRLVP